MIEAMRTRVSSDSFFPSASRAALALALTLAAVSPALAQRERPTLDITGYVIDAELDTATHHLAATTVVTFTAPANLDIVNFGFHPALKVSKITDDSGKLLDGERTADGDIRITPSASFTPGQPVHWTFVYDGAITGNEDGPIEGIKLAAIQEPISYLLYAARWFPTSGYLTDRFTAEMHIRVPQGMRVFASGSAGKYHSVVLPNGKPGDEYDFKWAKPGFPGTVIAGRYVDPVSVGAGNVKIYTTPGHQQAANQLAQTATREFDFFTDQFRSQPGVRAPQRRRNPRRHSCLPHGAPEPRRHPRQPRWRQIQRSAAGQHHRPPVVGRRSQSPHAQRRMGSERHVPLWRALVSRG